MAEPRSSISARKRPRAPVEMAPTSDAAVGGVPTGLPPKKCTSLNPESSVRNLSCRSSAEAGKPKAEAASAAASAPCLNLVMVGPSLLGGSWWAAACCEQLSARGIPVLALDHASNRCNDPVTRRRSMKPEERLEYSPIVARPPLKLPGGARMVVWTIVNVEEWDIDRPM